VPGNYHPFMRMAAAAAVASMTVLLAGCGTDPGRTGRAESSQTGPQAGSRAQAEAFARQLMARLVFPSGTQPVRLSPLPSLLRDPWAGPGGSSAPGSVDVGRLDTVSLGLAGTQAFLLTHAPGGANLTGTGHQNGPDGDVERDLYIHLGSLPRGINDAEIVMLMIPRGATSTRIATYVRVIWFPSRTAAEHLDPADFGAVSVRATLLNPKLHNVTRTFRSSADLARLAGLLNGLSAEPNTMHTCPSSTATYQITFEPRTVQHSAVVVTTYGCYGATVTTGGVPQPALLDPGNAVAASAARMLGISSTHS
jgi:hypothetical protein